MTLARVLLALRRPLRAPSRTGLARAVVGAWLAVHGFVVAAAPVADALAGHTESVVAHWEDAQDQSCPPLHDPATCQLCQQVTSALSDGPVDRVAPAVVVRQAAVGPQEPGLGAAPAVLPGGASPRGPPRG